MMGKGPHEGLPLRGMDSRLREKNGWRDGFLREGPHGEK